MIKSFQCYGGSRRYDPHPSRKPVRRSKLVKLANFKPAKKAYEIGNLAKFVFDFSVGLEDSTHPDMEGPVNR